MSYALVRLSTLLAPASACVLIAACAGPASRGAATAVPVVTAQTQFRELQNVFLGKYPKASSLVDTSGYFSRTAQEFKDEAGAKAAAHDDFVRWCELKAGTVYLTVRRDTVPTPVFEAAHAASAMRTLSRQRPGFSWRNTFDEDEPACVIAGARYLLFSAKDRSDHGSTFRTITWLSEDEIATTGQQALRELDSQRLAEAVNRKAHAKADEDALSQAKLAEHRRISFLGNAAAGTRLVCNGRQHVNQALDLVGLSCNGVSVSFGELAQYGWNVTTQTSTPLDMNGVPQGRGIDLVAVKTR